MTEPNPEEAQALKSFIRDELGCGCPEEVFSKIRIEKNPNAFYGLSIDYLITIGDRLLVGICCLSQNLEKGIDAKVEKSLAAGKRMRDNVGFNRFRLVVISENHDSFVDVVQERFADLTGLDDKVHLHIINYHRYWWKNR